MQLALEPASCTGEGLRELRAAGADGRPVARSPPVWRGARKRGLRDRFGRFLIISGYALLGVALDTGVHSAVGLWSARTEESLQSTGVHILLTVALWGIPAAILGRIGFKLASEKALATAEVSVDL
jgi:hypothetical protein